MNTPRVKEVAKKRNSLRAAAATAKRHGDMEESRGTPVSSSAHRKQQRKKVTKECSTSSAQPSHTPPAAVRKREPFKDKNSEHPLSISDSCPAKLAPSRKRGAIIPLAENNWSSPPNTRPRVLRDSETVLAEGRPQAHPLKPLQSTNRQMGKRRKAATVKSRTVPECQKENNPGSVAAREGTPRSTVQDELFLASDSTQAPLNPASADDSAQAVAMKRSERHRKVKSCWDARWRMCVRGA